MLGYRVAAPDEFLAITGMNIPKHSIKIVKAGWVLPFQRCMRFSVQPRDYAIDLQAMTKEKLQFLLPVIFTVGPDVQHTGADDSLTKYAMLLAQGDDVRRREERDHLGMIVKGIIEGETRVLVSSMTMEEIFTEREEFKRRVIRNIQGELDQFGLKIYNSNVKELRDAPGSEYFQSLSQKAHEGATNQARIDVADAQLRGTVGEAQRHGEQEREIAKINAETAVQRTEREVERAQAESKLHTRQAQLSRDVEVARVEAKRTLESKDEDLKKEVAIKRAVTEMERLRGTEVVRATIEREAKRQEADAKAYETATAAQADSERSQRMADAAAYRTQKEAEAGAAAHFASVTRKTDALAYQLTKEAEATATKTEKAAAAEAAATFARQTREADAAAYSTPKQADAGAYRSDKGAEAEAAARLRLAEADLAARIKEAEGMAAMADAYAKMSNAFGGPDGLLRYLMIDKGTYVELSKANAEAVAGMQPKISIWNTGTSEGGQGKGQQAGVDTIRSVYQILPPLMETVHDQTGIRFPQWQFGKLAAGTEAASQEVKGKQIKRINGVKEVS